MALYLHTSQRGEADNPQLASLPSPWAFGNGTSLGLRHLWHIMATPSPTYTQIPLPPRSALSSPLGETWDPSAGL